MQGTRGLGAIPSDDGVVVRDGILRSQHTGQGLGGGFRGIQALKEAPSERDNESFHAELAALLHDAEMLEEEEERGARKRGKLPPHAPFPSRATREAVPLNVRKLMAADAKEFEAAAPIKARMAVQRAAKAAAHLHSIEEQGSSDRRKAWAARFEQLGDVWMRKLRHCKWRQSLRMAFEVPALYSAKHSESGYLLGKPEFVAACNYSLIRDPKRMSAAEFDSIFKAAFEVFDVDGTGRVDYREFTAAFLFFRVPPSTDSSLLVDTWFRQYDGDVNGGILPSEFLRIMTTLATTAEEAAGVLRLCNMKELVGAVAAHAARRAAQKAAGLYADIAREDASELSGGMGIRFDEEEEGGSRRRMRVDVREEVASSGVGFLGRFEAVPRGDEVKRATPLSSSPAPTPGRARSVSPSRSPSPERSRSGPSTRARSAFKRDPASAGVKQGGPLPPVADDDPEAPWNRGLGTLTEVRVFYSRMDSRRAGFDVASPIPANSLIARESRRRESTAVGRRGSMEDLWAAAFSGNGPAMAAKTRRESSKETIDYQLRLTPLPNLRRHMGLGGSGRGEVELVDPMEEAAAKAAEIRDLRAAVRDAEAAVLDDPMEAANRRKVQHLLKDLELVQGRPLTPAIPLDPDAPSYRSNDPLARTGVFRPPSPDMTRTRSKAEALIDEPTPLPVLYRSMERVLGRAFAPPHDRVSLAMLRHMVRESPGLLEELHRLRLARLPPIIRSAYLAWQLDMQIKLGQKRFDALREEVLSRRALALWRARQLATWFGAWKGWARHLVWTRIKANSMRARRAVRRWFMWARSYRLTFLGTATARTYYLVTLLRKCFKALHSQKCIGRQSSESKRNRADAFHRSMVLGRAWEGLREATKDARASSHHDARKLKFAFLTWQRGINSIREDNARTEVGARVLEERIKKTATFLDGEERAKAEREAAEAEVAAYEAFMAEAERVREGERLAGMRRAAEAKLRNVRVKEAQETALHESTMERIAAFAAAFEAEWSIRIESSVSEARAKSEEYCFSDEGQLGMKEDAKALLMADNVDAVSQKESAFVARFDMSDGCIHFTAAADPTLRSPYFKKGRPELDLNMDAMQLKEAIYVATAHYVAKKGVQTREGMLQEKAKAWIRVRKERVSSLLSKRVLAIQQGRMLMRAMRAATEIRHDPYTGTLYYVTVATGRAFDNKPFLFRGGVVHPPPDFIMRLDRDTGDVTYQNRRVPWRISPDPPRGYRLCYACGRDFVSRICPGEGCEGYNYCWPCFEAYHPRADPQWRGHWAEAARVDVHKLDEFQWAEYSAALELHKQRVADALAGVSSVPYNPALHVYDDAEGVEAPLAFSSPPLGPKVGGVWEGDAEGAVHTDGGFSQGGSDGGMRALRLTIETEDSSRLDTMGAMGLNEELGVRARAAEDTGPDLGLRINLSGESITE